MRLTAALDSLLRSSITWLQGRVPLCSTAPVTPLRPRILFRRFHDFPKCAKQYNTFYAQYQEKLKSCYEDMKIDRGRDILLIKIRDFVDMLMRWPASLEEGFWREIIKRRIVVNDPDWIKAFPHHWAAFFNQIPKPAELVHPIQVLIPRRPISPCAELFVDASFSQYQQNCVCGGGIMFVSGNGYPELFWTTFKETTSFGAEGIVLLRSIIHAQSKGVTQIKINSDNFDWVDAIRGHAFIHPEFSKLYCDIMTRLSKFDSWDVVHIPREGNKIADLISHYIRLRHRRASVLPKGVQDLEMCMQMRISGLNAELTRFSVGLPSIRVETVSPTRGPRISPRSGVCRGICEENSNFVSKGVIAIDP